MHAEQQDQQRRHQRTAADTGHADQHADDESRQRIKRIDHEYGPLRGRHCGLASI
jgi:hypothetical protein